MAKCVNTNTEAKRSTLPKWRRITDAVRHELATERSGERGQFYTIRELAAKHGISTLTAQRVFRELNALGLIESHGRRGTRVRRAIGGQTLHVCLRDDQFSAPGGMRSFLSINTLFDGIKAGENGQFADLRPIGFRLLQRNMKAFAGQPVLVSANVFLDIAGEQAVLNRERLAEVAQALHPVVFHCFAELPGVSQVACDLYNGIRQTVDHLADAGHTGLGLLSGPLDHVWFRPRFQAFVDGLFARDLPLLPERVKVTSGRDRDEDFQAVAALLALPQPPTALVCANDSRALHVLEYCARQGIAIPETLAVTGFDNLPEGALSQPTLTTIDGRDFEAGRQCAALLRRQLQGELTTPEIVRVEPRLITRESSHA
jgi:hypothetical protein